MYVHYEPNYRFRSICNPGAYVARFTDCEYLTTCPKCIELINQKAQQEKVDEADECLVVDNCPSLPCLSKRYGEIVRNEIYG